MHGTDRPRGNLLLGVKLLLAPSESAHAANRAWFAEPCSSGSRATASFVEGLWQRIGDSMVALY